MTTQTPYESMSEEQLATIAQHNELLIRLIKRIMALPMKVMPAEEKVEWIDFLAGLEGTAFLAKLERRAEA